MQKSLRGRSSSETKYRLISLLALLPFVAIGGCSGIVSGQNVKQPPPPQTYGFTGTVTAAANGGGSTLSLSGAATASTTADTAGNYGFDSLANGTYTVTPSRNGYVFNPPSQTITINGATPAPVNFTATPQSAQTFSLSGTLSPATGSSGATVKLSGASSASTVADSSGNFSFSGLSNGNYTVTPTKSGITFTPSSQAVAISGKNVSGVNFTAAGQTFSVSGTIIGGSGATVGLSGGAGASTTADASGNFNFTGLGNGSYIITPSKLGFTVSPSSQSVTVSGANVTTINFTATAQTFSISGTITNGSGATVALSGAATATVTADGSGNFSFSQLSNGTYNLTPSKSGYSISPTSKSVTVSGANLTGANFTATALTYSVSGTISPTTGGVGATVTLSGAVSAIATTNSSGNYTFSGLPNGNYAVTPSNTGYSFNPATQAVTVNGANVTGINFTATAAAPTYTISGSLTPASVGAGATVTLSGAGSGMTSANAAGSFSFSALANGVYTITPSSTTATFNPASTTVTVSNANVSGVSFTATATANVVFFDDFTGTTLDSAWTPLTVPGNSGNGEQQCYELADASVANGNLILNAQQQTVTCTNGKTYNYTAGAVMWTSFNFQYGTVEYRAKMAGGQGPWPAIWLLGSDCQTPMIANVCKTWPNLGSEEIDLTEVKNGNHTDPTFNALAATGGWQTCDPSGITDVSQNYHVYQFVWTKASESLYIDGVKKCEYTSNIVTSHMFMIINIAMGGSGGSINNATLPQTTTVDFVKVTQP